MMIKKSGVALFLCSLVFSSLGSAKATSNIRFTKGLLKKISCSYSGYNDPNAQFDFDSLDKKNAVCDPFNGDGSSAATNGLQARLIVRSSSMAAHPHSVINFLNDGTWLDQKVYFSDVNVPTQDFTKGFSTGDGNVLLDENGKALTENFALEYTSTLQLGDKDTAGDYEISLLSDDGSRLYIQENGNWNELINNDGDHSTKMGCSLRTIHMDKDTQIPIKLVYYQGRGSSLANVMIWRRHPRARKWSSNRFRSLCGFAGDKLFFNKHEKKTFAMYLLEWEGWRVIGKSSYKMPAQASNPCVTPTLAISQFQVASTASTSAVLTWQTNIPASSQLKISNVFTGESLTTALDSNLVTSHSVTVSGLTAGAVYQVQAISVDAKGNSLTSDPVTVAP